MGTLIWRLNITTLKTGWWFQPSWKILVNWEGLSHILWTKIKKCSKPPTRLATGHQEINNFPAIFDYQIGILDFIESLSVGIFVTWMVSGHKLPCWSADSINKVGWKKTRPATGTLNVIPRLLTFHVFPLILSLPPNNSEVSLVVFSPRILFSVAQQSLPLLENTSKKNRLISFMSGMWFYEILLGLNFVLQLSGAHSSF